jgi:hypothetical protein
MNQTNGHDHHHEIMTAKEVAGELRCSKAHAYQLLNGEVEGVAVLPHIRLGRRKVVRRSSFEAWKAANETRGILQRTEQNAVDAEGKGI